MNLQVVFGSCGGFHRHYGGSSTEIDLEDVDIDKILDDIGKDYIKEYFDLVEADA